MQLFAELMECLQDRNKQFAQRSSRQVLKNVEANLFLSQLGDGCWRQEPLQGIGSFSGGGICCELEGEEDMDVTTWTQQFSASRRLWQAR